MILASFLISLLLVAAAMAYMVAKGISLFRQAKGTGRTLTAELSSFEARATRTERLLSEAERSSRALAEAQERLRISLARLQVLTEALERSRRRTQWIRGYVPYL